jgi:hypothetical protein
MSIARIKIIFLAAVAYLFLAVISVPAALATTEPTGFAPSLYFGWEVNEKTGGNTCTVASGNGCKAGVTNRGAGGFIFPTSVAVAKKTGEEGVVYVADNVNRRIQEFNEKGEFLLMFGWNVNKAKLADVSASQAERDVCTVSEVDGGAGCGSGEEGTGVGSGSFQQMFKDTDDVAVDQNTGDVYVFDNGYDRVDEFNPKGELILVIGGEVNRTKDDEAGSDEAEKNLCTAASGDTCQPGSKRVGDGAFENEEEDGDLLALGGSEDSILYFGDRGRVQEFESETGRWVDEIPLFALSASGSVTALAADADGDVFVADSEASGVRMYNPQGVLQPGVVDPEGNEDHRVIEGIALDFSDQLGLIQQEPREGIAQAPALGLLYKTSGELIVEFTPRSGSLPGKPVGLSFDTSESDGGMYLAGSESQEIEVYIPQHGPTVSTCSAEDVASTSAVLCGEIDPNGTSSTNGFFEYGPVGGSSRDTSIVFEGAGTTLETYNAQLSGLIPNQAYHFTAAFEAGGEQKSAPNMQEFHTTTPPPEIAGEPSASFVKDQSAVLRATVDPENATTHYHFEYAKYSESCSRLQACVGTTILITPGGTSSAYGPISDIEEVEGLSPQATYIYRLVAGNKFEEERAGKTVHEGGESIGQEGMFTTGSAPIVRAETGPVSGVGTTSAVMSGAVDPGGRSAAYKFELGMNKGVATNYGIVFSGSVGSSAVWVPESVAVGGLQPGTPYAYRVIAESGYGQAQGAAVSFLTEGFPSVLVSPLPLAMLATPRTAFPTEKPVVRSLTRAQKLANALKVCRKDKSKARRVACEHKARNEFGTKAKKKKKVRKA